ncbi:hypothetical protein ONE63_001101 [Megalurothrips usitatus]|uniref:Uncharacterized protein n=1 Tax=Megalurothrips usitatus TaxID=439358 RepID=A0AAV7XB49_9NEOP|nr:hypothetical protein ONE63_001101 [Megalurothrips usitatus]
MRSAAHGIGTSADERPAAGEKATVHRGSLTAVMDLPKSIIFGLLNVLSCFLASSAGRNKGKASRTAD